MNFSRIIWWLIPPPPPAALYSGKQIKSFSLLLLLSIQRLSHLNSLRKGKEQMLIFASAAFVAVVKVAICCFFHYGLDRRYWLDTFLQGFILGFIFCIFFLWESKNRARLKIEALFFYSWMNSTLFYRKFYNSSFY